MDEDARPMEETESLGQRIRRIRTDRGMSLAKVVRDDFSRAFLNQAQALISLGRKEQAAQILAHERQEIELHNDRHRIERLNTVERGQEFRYGGDAVKAHLQLADRAQRAGQNHDELEHYRAARVLL